MACAVLPGLHKDLSCVGVSANRGAGTTESSQHDKVIRLGAESACTFEGTNGRFVVALAECAKAAPRPPSGSRSSHPFIARSSRTFEFSGSRRQSAGTKGWASQYDCGIFRQFEADNCYRVSLQPTLKVGS